MKYSKLISFIELILFIVILAYLACGVPEAPPLPDAEINNDPILNISLPLNNTLLDNSSQNHTSNISLNNYSNSSSNPQVNPYDNYTIDLCFNAIKDHGEKGIDCSGPCERQCPETLNDVKLNEEPLNLCHNGIMDENEHGVDCGGNCETICQENAEMINEQENLGENEVGVKPVEIVPDEQVMPDGQQKSLGIFYFILFGLIFLIMMGFLLYVKLKKYAKPFEKKQKIPADDILSKAEAYLRVCLKNGYEYNQIKQSLIKNGWPDNDIEIAYQRIKNGG